MREHDFDKDGKLSYLEFKAIIFGWRGLVFGKLTSVEVASPTLKSQDKQLS